MYRHLKDDNLRMQKELESTIYNLKAQLTELQNGKVVSLNPKQENCNLSQFDDVKAQLLQLRVSIKIICVVIINVLMGKLFSFTNCSIW